MKIRILILLLACPVIIVAQQFHYPVPPDSISDRQGRINFMLEHFFVENAYNDTTLFNRPKLLLDYIYLLKQVDVGRQEKAINSLISCASKINDNLGMALYWLDNMLYDSASPHYDEDIYLRILEHVVNSDVDSVMKIIPKERIKILKKNKVGNIANDIMYVDKAGGEHRLFEIDAPLLLLVFNNPDCSNCQRAEKTISNDTNIQNLIKKNYLKVVAITPDSNYDEWKEHSYPDGWIVGFDKDKLIYSQRLYDIQRYPSMYILDKGKRVLLKEANIERVCNYLNVMLIP